jgi:site-specific recombinase XerD
MNPTAASLPVIIPLYEEFLLHLQSDNYSTETLYNYQRDLLTFNIFLQTEIKKVFTDFKKSDIDEYKAYLLSRDRVTPLLGLIGETRLQSGSVNRTLSSLRSYLKFLTMQDYLVPVAPEHITLVRKEHKIAKVADLPELIELIQSPTNFEENPIIAARNRAMLEVLFATGVRISELLSMNRQDIHHDNRVFIFGKGKKERFVYLTNRAKHYIDQYLSLRSDGDQALFVPLRGKRKNTKNVRISPNYLQERIKKYREKLHLSLPTSAHSLRHGFATYMAQEGASPVAIQRLLGHESLNTTTRYVNPSDQFAADSHKKFHPLSEANEGE